MRLLLAILCAGPFCLSLPMALAQSLDVPPQKTATKKKTKKKKSVETTFEKTVIIERKPSALEICSQGAASLENLDAALEACNQAAEEDRDDGDVYYFRGFNLFHLERFSEAEDDFSKAIDLDTGYLARSYYQRGACKEYQGRLRDASEDFKKAHELRPEWSAARRKVEEYHWAYQ